jgi:hypothetical protein
MGSKIKAIFLFVIIGGVVVYLFTASWFAKGFKGLDSLVAISSSSRLFGSGSSSLTTPPIGPTIPEGPPPTTIEAPPPTSAQSSSAIPLYEIPAGFTASELSPYFHQVVFGSISAATYYYYGTISLETNIPQNQKIDITGWQIKTLDSGEYIPQAIDVYDPTGLTAPSDILVGEGDTVYLYSSTGSFNLRLNECIGYLAPFTNSEPLLPEICPPLNYSQIQNFTGQCQNYIESLGLCQAPNLSSPQIPPNDYACQDYLQNNLTYKSCFDQHEADANFLSNQIWVWTGNNVLNPDHDTVELLDRNGLLVDIETY